MGMQKHHDIIVGKLVMEYIMPSNVFTNDLHDYIILFYSLFFIVKFFNQVLMLFSFTVNLSDKI
jgi:hypothetical protein